MLRISMIMTRFLKFSLATFIVGTLACSAIAEPAAKATENASLIDEAENTGAKASPAKKEESVKKEPSAEKAAPEEKSPACEPAPDKEASSVPVVPIVFSTIGTIAFIVLAIIF